MDANRFSDEVGIRKGGHSARRDDVSGPGNSPAAGYASEHISAAARAAQQFRGGEPACEERAKIDRKADVGRRSYGRWRSYF
jgi:hypothetical protein